MKWIVVVVILIFAGWKAAVFLMENSSGAAAMANVDSLQAKAVDSTTKNLDSIKSGKNGLDTISKNPVSLPKGAIDTKDVQPQQVVEFAKTLIGVPYLYGSTDPAKGFDCSGFITHVFNHFNITVPRSSIDFTNVGREVSAAQAAAGDLILFTGTDSTEKFVGHMGIVVSNTDTLRFIHSTSGKQYGVTITPLSHYYQARYVKTVRIFPG
jgi:cell wall-associated NlpC family hydrolase